MIETFGFETALKLMKEGKVVRRIQFGENIEVFAQYPTELSKMTEPYIVMRKYGNGEVNDKYFPVDLSVESLFAEDWYEVLPQDLESGE